MKKTCKGTQLSFEEEIIGPRIENRKDITKAVDNCLKCVHLLRITSYDKKDNKKYSYECKWSNIKFGEYNTSRQSIPTPKECILIKNTEQTK